MVNEYCDICPICGEAIDEFGDSYTEMNSFICADCQKELERQEEAKRRRLYEK